MSGVVQPSELELQVLSVLWRRGALTAREVGEALPDGKERAYTTVLTVMQVMERKGLVEIVERRGNANVYGAKVAKGKVMRPLVRGWVAKIFGGSASAAVQQLLSEADVDAGEIEKIEAFLKEYKAQQQKKD